MLTDESWGPVMINNTTTIGLSALVVLCASSAAAQLPKRLPNPADSLLARLVGQWDMRGEVRGRPAAYNAVGGWTLAHKYVELHLRDRAKAGYEALVFLGADTLAGHVLVHWLDNTGAAFSVPAGTGSVIGDTLRFEFAYSSGPFRDTFIYRRRPNEWYMLLESGDGHGGWKPFATYVARRRADAVSRPE